MIPINTTQPDTDITKEIDTINNNTLISDEILLGGDTESVKGDSEGGDKAVEAEESLIPKEPTQWEVFADGIIKTHLEKNLKKGPNSNKDNLEDNHTEQNIEL